MSETKLVCHEETCPALRPMSGSADGYATYRHACACRGAEWLAELLARVDKIVATDEPNDDHPLGTVLNIGARL
jgi:hypothetical protein